MTTATIDGRAVERGAFATLAHGLRLTPEFREGLPVTLLLAFLATGGRVVVPVAVQQTIDHGLNAPGTPDLGLVRLACGLAALAVAVTAVANFLMNVRLYRTTENGLLALRVRAFRRVHDLSVLHQASERRGSLVSRVTSDVDTISTFMQFGGLLVLVSIAQVVLTTGIMLVWSWQLTLLVYACFLPLVLAIRLFQRKLQGAYGAVRERIGLLLGAVAESVVGAPVIRAYGVQARTAERIDTAVASTMNAQVRAQTIAATTFSLGELTAAIANGAVVVIGVLLGVGGHITTGRLVGFLFLVTLFVQPVQVATEVLNEAQNAVAGMRRVLGVLDTPTDVGDPPDGATLERGPVGVRFDHVSFAYPGGPEVLHDVDLEIAPQTRVAIVGETGSGKTTFAKLLTRLMDPTRGSVLLNGLPLDGISFASLRSRVVMVPQDGFLFDSTVSDNVRYGLPEATDEQIAAAFGELGLADWVEQLPAGLATAVGERGESLSVGERQLVAIARAYIADPDLLVLDEATSAVDPATEVRLNRALDSLTRGRTTITIAHRLSTAEAADDVLVVDKGVVVQRGPHAELVAHDGVYARLHASWMSQSR
ncbi:MAG: ABC transporter ATP-binding protein/permease [Actinobacteria bacterium]|nr:ABC transporter ATP-binding protein/permease [Actinomycetota bacterium]MCA1721923.1 ABC transporter ATP-binding protein/permease [Actinomycetota bacterium]